MGQYLVKDGLLQSPSGVSAHYTSSAHLLSINIGSTDDPWALGMFGDATPIVLWPGGSVSSSLAPDWELNAPGSMGVHVSMLRTTRPSGSDIAIAVQFDGTYDSAISPATLSAVHYVDGVQAELWQVPLDVSVGTFPGLLQLKDGVFRVLDSTGAERGALDIGVGDGTTPGLASWATTRSDLAPVMVGADLNNSTHVQNTDALDYFYYDGTLSGITRTAFWANLIRSQEVV